MEEPTRSEDVASPDTTQTKSTQKVKVNKPKKAVSGELRKLGLYACLMYLFFGLLIMSPLYGYVVMRPETPTSLLGKQYAFIYDKITKILTAPREEYFFAGPSGKKLHGWLFRTPNTDTVVIVHHGNAGNILNRLFIAKHLIIAGASVFLYDYEGYGKSEGTPNLNQLTPDGLAAYDFVKNDLKFNHIVNYGESFGSNVASNVSMARPCDALILQSGLCSLPAVAKSGPFFINLYPDFIFPDPKLDNLAIIGNIKKPILIVHGLKDKLVPASHSQQLFDKAAQPKRLVMLPECGHNDVGEKDEMLFEVSLKDFVDDLKSGKLLNQSSVAKNPH